MKKYIQNPMTFLKSLVLCQVVFLLACQQVPVPGGGGEGETTVIDNTKIVSPCEDGTFNCIQDHDGSDQIFTSMEGWKLSIYNQCLLTCYDSYDCTNIPESFIEESADDAPYTSVSAINSAANGAGMSCSADNGVNVHTQCQQQCHENVYGPEVDDSEWGSDNFAWPENARAIEVIIRTCLDGKNRAAMVFQGLEAHYKNIYRRKHPLCGIGGIDNKTVVKYRPIKESSISFPNGQSFNINAFPGSVDEEYESKYRNWQGGIQFGIHKDLRPYIKGNGRWLMKHFRSDLGNIDLAGNANVDNSESKSLFALYQYISESHNLHPNALSWVRISPPPVTTGVKVHMIYVDESPQ